MGTSGSLWLLPDWDLQLGKRSLWTEGPGDAQVHLEGAEIAKDTMEEKWWVGWGLSPSPGELGQRDPVEGCPG